MSATNVFANASPVTEGSRFSSPWVKGGIAFGGVLTVATAYMLLSGQASDMIHGQAAKREQPAPQFAPNTTRFTPAKAATASIRPKAAGPNFANKSGGGGGGGQGEVLTGSMDAYTAPRSGSSVGARAGAATAPGESDEDAALRKGRGGPGSLEESLVPTKFTASVVTELPHPDYLIEKGRHLPCTDLTIINTTYAGGVTAILPKEIRGETGDVTLLGGGAKITGTIQHGISNGAETAFVLWQDISTKIMRDNYGVPHQFRIEVDSPASTELGETGLPGELNRHLLPKIGGVIGLSALQGVTQGLGGLLQGHGNNSNNGSPSINFNSMESGSQSAANMLARQWLEIPDVLRRLQGKACTVELMRDLDLKPAYPTLRSLLAMEKGNRR